MAATAVVAGCSTQKNTAGSRWWHSFTARYNTYYNGAMAYVDGSLEKEKGNKDNYTELLPLYPVGNKASRDLGKSHFDRAIEKSQKAIQLHSIKKRPEWKHNRKKTERDLEWLSRREYNPFLWKAWMLMGRSQFHKGNFDEAAATFSYMSRLYKGQPAIYDKARAWLARCYTEEGWLYDAEDVIRNQQRDTIHWRAVKEWDYTYADYYLRSAQYEKAATYLRKVIKHEMRSKQRARQWFIMGQIQKLLGNNKQAYDAFRHVVRQNPPYELEFNARIAMTEVLADGQYSKMISRLKRMAANDNNKDYLDQVYYAMGNIYLANRDTANAISSYEKGNEKATRSGIERGVLLLKLGDLYWTMEKFSDARRCYGSAIGMLDKDRDDYEQLSERSKVLDELVPHTDAIHLQDSLQALALMPESERNAAIDRVIEELKKKEREERHKQQEAEAASKLADGGGSETANTPAQNTMPDMTLGGQTGLWYFYNPVAVTQGKDAFQRLWGKRENADDWQRNNKTVVSSMGDMPSDDELTDAQRDSIAAAEARQDSLEQRTDSAQNDPHRREYYLKQIPFTPEQVEASNKIIMVSLDKAGVIFKDRLDNLPLSEKHLTRVANQYPSYEQMDEVLYHLYLLYQRMNRPGEAESYLQKLKSAHPDSKWTALLSDPYFIENSKFGEHIEDSLYTATYEAFRAGRYSEVERGSRMSEERFPLGANRDKFLFIGGMAKLNSGNADGCMADMQQVVEKYPKGRISELAGMIINGVKAGRRLHGGRFDMEGVWNRRSEVLNDSDAIKKAAFTAEREGSFVFTLAYHPDSINENKLLFEMARFNFTNYLVRNFNLEISDLGGPHQMLVSGFNSFDETWQYARDLYAQKPIMQLLGHLRGTIISQKNLELIGTALSQKDYDAFYAKHFAPLKVNTRYLLTEPEEVTSPRERDLQEEIESKAPTKADIESEQQDNSFSVEEEPTGNNQVPTNEYINVGEEPAAPQTQQPSQEIAVPQEPQTTEPQAPATDDSGITIEEPQPAPVQPAAPTIEEQTITIDQSDATTVVEAPQTTEQQTITVAEEPQPTQQPKASTAPEQPKAAEKPATKPAEVPKQAEQPAQQNDIEDTGIYFDDFGNQPAAPQQPNNKQPIDINIEDEYYELEGF